MPKLVIEEGDQKGAVYNFRARNAIVAGRGEDTDFIIQDSHASRRHFTIEKRKDSFYLRDLGSTNGTFLNDTPVKSQRLKSGGKIRVGQTVFMFVDEDDEDPLLGQSIGGYLIHACVGKGGMGTVYMASQLSMDRVVALKILSERLVKRKDFVNQFISEARAAGRLNHPNIVQVHDVGKTDKIYYYSMEFMKGGSVQDLLLRVKKISFAEAVPMVIDAARGLGFAESKDIIHRDIKPDNLMLADNKAVKICDLGLAEVLSTEEQGANREVMGSPHYMSPEQASGKSLDHRSDIYSLGAAFYRMLAGQTPFSGKTPKQIIQRHINDNPKPLKEFGIPRAVAQIVEKMMSKDLGKRYSSATTVVSDLEKLRSMPKPMAVGRERVAKHRFRSAHRSRGDPLLVGAIILAFVAGLIYLLLYLFVFHPGATITIGGAEDNGKVVARRSEQVSKAVVDSTSEARSALSRAGAYRRSHPDEWNKIIAEYREVVSKFPGTKTASLAAKTIGEVRKEREKSKYLSAAKNDFSEAVKRSDELLSLSRYGDVIRTFSTIAEKYPDTRWGSDAKAKVIRLPANAAKTYQEIVEKAESHIEAGQHDKAKVLYQAVVSSYGIPTIVKDAQDQMAEIGRSLVARRSEKAEDSLRRTNGLLKARAFGEAIAELRNIPLEGLPKEFSSRVRHGLEEAGRLNVLKQKLIASINGQVLAGRIVTIEKDLRGKLIRADESAVTIKLPEGETAKSWDELNTVLVCNIAAQSSLKPEDYLALGILCLREEQSQLALGHLEKAAKKKALNAACRPYIQEAELVSRGLVEERENKKKVTRSTRETARKISRFHKVTRAKIYSKVGESTGKARRFQGDLEEARVLARLHNFPKSASLLNKIVIKEKNRNPDLAFEAACEMAKVLVLRGKAAAVWIKQAEALERKAENPTGSADEIREWVENYPDAKAALEKMLEKQKGFPLDPDVQWETMKAYNDAGFHLDCLAAVIRMEKDFAGDSHVGSGDATWLRAQLYRQLWLFEETIEALDKLVKDHPEHSSVTGPDIEFMMADIYWYKHKRYEAAGMYKDLLEKHPDLPVRQRRIARQRIAKSSHD